MGQKVSSKSKPSKVAPRVQAKKAPQVTAKKK